MGFRNFSSMLNVTITKVAPSSERTEAILSMMMMSCVWLAVRDMLLSLDSHTGRLRDSAAKVSVEVDQEQMLIKCGRIEVKRC